MAPTTSPSQSTSPVTATSGGAAAARDASIAAVLDTHVHADHLSGGRTLADELGVPYYPGGGRRARDVAYAFEPLARNETLDVGGVSVKALATPAIPTTARAI